MKQAIRGPRFHLSKIRCIVVWQVQAELLCSVPEVGPVLAAVLVVELPELDHLNGREIAVLVSWPPESVPRPAPCLRRSRLRAHDPLHDHPDRYPTQPCHP